MSDLTNQLLKADFRIESIKKLRTILWKSVIGYQWGEFRNNISDPPSIDHLLSGSIENGKLSIEAQKLATHIISYFILGFEQSFTESNLTSNRNWLKVYCEEILGGYEILTFNYDRLVESIINDRSLSITHLYGSIGAIADIPFGSTNNDIQKLKVASHNFQLINSERKPIEWNHNQKFEKVLFLGFGYDKLNLEILNFKALNFKYMAGTGKYLSEVRKKELQENFGIEIEDSYCFEFCKKHL